MHVTKWQNGTAGSSENLFGQGLQIQCILKEGCFGYSRQPIHIFPGRTLFPQSVEMYEYGGGGGFFNPRGGLYIYIYLIL